MEISLFRLVLIFSILFLSSCSLADNGYHLTGSEPAIIPPIQAIATAGSDTLWVITDRNELIKLSERGKKQLLLDPPMRPELVFFLNEIEGWAYDTNRQVWATMDGGATWTKKGTHPEFGIGAVDLVFSDNRNGWLVLSLGVFVTEDGGDSWTMAYPTEQFSYSTLHAQPTCLTVVNPDVAWLGMTAGTVLLTRDRGKSWEKVLKLGSADFSSIHATSYREAWVGPGSGGIDGLYYTDDGGKNWSQILTDDVRKNFGRSSLSFPSPDTGWLIGIEFVRDVYSTEPIKGVAFKTTDGKSWEKLRSDIFKLKFDEVEFTDSLNGWMLGFDHRENHSYLYRTNDGGNTWQKDYELKRPKRY